MSIPYNAIVIVFDTLRYDYSKGLRKVLLREGFSELLNCISPSSWTLPAHVSMLSGKYPSIHGVHEAPWKKADKIRITKKVNLLSCTLKRMGYNTYLFTSNPYVHPFFGFQCFDVVIERFPNGRDILSFEERKTIKDLRRSYGRFKTLVKLIQKGQFWVLAKLPPHYLWRLASEIYRLSPFYKINLGTQDLINSISSTNLNMPFFSLINVMEMHEPYLKDREKDITKNLKMNFIPEGSYDIDLEKIKKEYLNRSKRLPEYIQDLFDIFREKNVFDNSIIIVTSDHGQLLGEDGKIGHGTFLYDELLRVPCFIRIPNKTLEVNMEGNRWISLNRIQDIIINIIDKYEVLDYEAFFEGLYSDVTFAESFGIAQNIKGISEEQRKPFEKHRIAIYHSCYKAIYNITDKSLERIVSYTDSNITNDVKKMLVEDVKYFLEEIKFKNVIKKLKLKGRL